MVTVGFGGIVGLAAAGVGALELVTHDVLPGRSYLDQLDGACSVPAPPLVFSAPGPSVSGTFYSRARRRDVGYTIAYPPGERPDNRLPLIIGLHAYGGITATPSAPSAWRTRWRCGLAASRCRRWSSRQPTAVAGIGIRIRTTTRWEWSSAN
jgi:hypothetical protein